MSKSTEKDRERADGLADYLADFTSGRGSTEADCIFEALQEARADERARIVNAIRDLEISMRRSPFPSSDVALNRSHAAVARDIANTIESGEL